MTLNVNEALISLNLGLDFFCEEHPLQYQGCSESIVRVALAVFGLYCCTFHLLQCHAVQEEAIWGLFCMGGASLLMLLVTILPFIFSHCMCI